MILRSVGIMVILFLLAMVAIGSYTWDRDWLVELKMELIEAVPALSVNTESKNNPWQPEIIVDEDKLAELPQQETPPTSFEDTKEIADDKQEAAWEVANTNDDMPTEEDFAQLPPGVNLDVPFFPQAPDGDRSLPWKDACEEASITLAAYFLNDLDPNEKRFKSDILGLVELQNKMFGDYIDTDIAQTAELFEAYYGLGKTLIIDNPTEQDIKYWLSQGNPIVAPFAGRELGNSHFTNGWPRYHMLVIRWYDAKYFYTNDVWTRHGKNFPYTYSVILDAMHDLTDEDINKGAKRMLVLLKD